MIKKINLNEQISEYYDHEMDINKLINFEAEQLKSADIKECVQKNCVDFYSISKSMSMVKYRNKAAANKTTKEFENKILFLLVNINAVGFKGFYKHFRDSILNILRYYAK